MSVLNDQQIINNTRIIPEDDHVRMIMSLPDGEEFSQLAKDADSAKKHIISWCESVRSYIKSKEQAREEELEAKKARRKMGEAVRPPEKPSNATSPAVSGDPKQLVVEHYKRLQEEIDSLGEEIEAKKSRRNSLRDERDKLKPVMEIWGVTE